MRKYNHFYKILDEDGKVLETFKYKFNAKNWIKKHKKGNLEKAWRKT